MTKTRAVSKLLSILLIATLIIIGLASCVDEEKNDDSDEENLCLVYEGKVNFQIVASSDLDTKGIKQVNELIAELSELGLEIPEEPVSDKDAEAVKNCEIIIGTGVLNREGCAVDVHDIGDDGYVIKIVGDRVIVAAGSNDRLEEAIGIFKKKVMGITAKIDTLEGATVTVERKYKGEQLTEYPIASVQIGNESLAGFCFSFDANNATIKLYVNKLRQMIYERCGFWLKLESELAEGQSAKNKFIIRVAEDLGEDNFKVYVSGNDLIMETTAPDRMQRGVDAFIEKYFNEKLTVSRFYATDKFTYDVVSIRYSEYGAVGDGKTDDFSALYRTHEAANSIGVKVMADEGAKYYIGKASHGKTIKVRTDVEWGDAEFIIDDSILLPTGPRGNNVFSISSENTEKVYYANGSTKKPQGVQGSFDGGVDDGELIFGKSSTALPDAVKQFVTEKSLVIVYNEDHKIYVRYGWNEGENNLEERLIVNADGTIDLEASPISWDYDKFTKISVRSVEDKPITISGGKFTTKANQIYYGFTQEELDAGWLKGPQYYYYNRGFSISRANVTIKNVEHYVTGEGSEGYPYGGFFGVSGAYNFLAENCILTGHKKYHENQADGKGTDMGSYDIAIGGAICATFKNCRQSNKITDRDYWGIMCGNFGKNIAYDGCTLSRFDAHTGIWNARVVNTTLGHSFSMIGGGLLYVDNVKKIDDGSTPTFLTFRADYGSIWHGDVIIKNSTMETEHSSGIKSINIMEGTWNTEWTDWKFGYELMMPQNVTIENFTCEGAELYAIKWNKLSEVSLTCRFPLSATKSLTVKNQLQDIYLSVPGNYLYTLSREGKITLDGDMIK